MGFIKPTRGSSRMFGHDTWTDGVRARSHVGYLVQSDSLFPELTGADQLAFAARLSGSDAPLQRRLLDLLELSKAALGRPLKTYSKGMRQKLALIAATQHDPELLILDEPTDGLDPLIQRAFEAHLLDCHAAGRTISCHPMTWARSIGSASAWLSCGKGDWCKRNRSKVCARSTDDGLRFCWRGHSTHLWSSLGPK
ncbi:MAG: ATP-binding cassette domain-containing protein [Thermomicrobiales bacterium]